MVTRAPPAARIREVHPGGQRRWLTLTWMLTAIVVVTGLAWWDERREASAALRDLGSEQALVATSLAESLRARLDTVALDAVLVGEHGPGTWSARYAPVLVRTAAEPPARTQDAARILVSVPLADGHVVDLGVSAPDLLGHDPQLETAGQLVLMLAAPGETAFHAADGRLLSSSAIRSALDRRERAVRLTRSEASELGLWERTAMAGLATVGTERFGQWAVVAVSTAARERDRQTRAAWRLVLSVLMASGLVLAFGGVALRIQRKELELERELAVAEAARARDEELQRAGRLATMGTFAMGIAHEVSTPLGVIVGRAEQLAGRLREDERGSRAAQAILQQADHIRQIIRRFLDLARGGTPSLGRADPGSIVRAAVSSTEHRFKQAGVLLETDIASEMPEIQCDRALLAHAVVNLLLNACDACTPGGHVRVTARHDADRVAFVVSDDGVGISPEHAARVTEPFFTTKAVSSGTGLGLAIATEIVKSHRGELTLAANDGRGTRACIEIPVAPDRGETHGHTN